MSIGHGALDEFALDGASVAVAGGSIAIAPAAGHTAASIRIDVTYTDATTSAANPFIIQSGPGSISAYSQDSSTACHFTYTQVGVSSTPTVFRDTVTNLLASFSNAAVAPGVPTIGTPVRGNASVAVAFTAPADNGGASITGYTATVSPGGFTGTGVSSPITVSGLTNGTAYTATVRATNSVGDSAESAASASFTPAAAPATPAAPTASAASATTATVTLVAPAANGSAITGYTVTSSPAGGTDSNAGSTSLTHTMTGLSTGVAYTFSFTATNAVGTSAASAASNSITPQNVASVGKVAPFVDTDVLTSVTCQAYQNVAGTMTATGTAPTPFTIASVTNGRGALVSVAPNGSSDGSFHGIVRWGTGSQYFADELNIAPTTYISDSTATVTKICTLPPGTDVSGTLGYQIYDSANAAVGSHVTTGILSIPSVTDGFCADITGAVGFTGSIVWDNGAGVYAADELVIPGRFGSGTGGGATRGRVINGN